MAGLGPEVNCSPALFWSFLGDCEPVNASTAGAGEDAAAAGAILGGTGEAGGAVGNGCTLEVSNEGTVGMAGIESVLSCFFSFPFPLGNMRVMAFAASCMDGPFTSFERATLCAGGPTLSFCFKRKSEGRLFNLGVGAGTAEAAVVAAVIEVAVVVAVAVAAAAVVVAVDADVIGA